MVRETEGAPVRKIDGFLLGCCETSNTGTALGNCVGSAKGISDGIADGTTLGYRLRELLGKYDGLDMGRPDGKAIGGMVPSPGGASVGLCEGSNADVELGETDGTTLGYRLRELLEMLD